MARSLLFLLLLPLILLMSKAEALSNSPILPKAAIFPVSKDSSTLQYVAHVSMGENLDSLNLVVDLNGPFVWMASGLKSASDSQQPIKSCSLKCSMAKSTRGGGAEYNSKTKSCTLLAENTISRISASGDLSEDVMAMEFWDGIGSSSFAKSEKFLLLSSPNLLLKGLAHEARGVLGLGDSRISLPSQFSTTFGFFERKFSLCLSPQKGALFLGGNPLESSMMFTPLISKKSGGDQEGYYIDVSSIKVSGKKLPLHQKGIILGAKISTIVPYTTFESKIYDAFVESYVGAAISMNLSLVQSVAPFEVCFSSRDGENVPIVDLVLQSELVKWRIHGEKSMVVVSDEVMCLGFLDGGLNPRDSIVVGGHQIEDHLLEFNLGNSMLGFASLLKGDKKCSDFEASSMDGEIL
ncbi:probable aspartic proteinase GIP2 [Salvia miltiorrhiza]|uniref:probable aspartic proteinase GIP2 n=1 Tax=Salvia miltiorrhiza TaxID=226208 RepID=UPI0025AC9781|nr:probable aspartic proteinase GIP2 [Salvia miltiorrhiza]